MRHPVKRCPECGNQFPIYFEKCIYCETDLREVIPSKHEPLNMSPIKTLTKAKPKKRGSIPRIKKFEGYDKLVEDATPENPIGGDR